ncbi:MAG TPA: hypothetical protein VF462_16385 [Micromonosporaceae bacterium]
MTAPDRALPREAQTGDEVDWTTPGATPEARPPRASTWRRIGHHIGSVEVLVALLLVLLVHLGGGGRQLHHP